MAYFSRICFFKYLKYSLGQDLYTVGLCLIIVGCSLVLSVSSTILLIVIINISLAENQRQQNPQNNGVQNIPYINEPQQISMPNYWFIYFFNLEFISFKYIYIFIINIAHSDGKDL